MNWQEVLSGGVGGAIVSAGWNFVSGLLLQRDQAASTKKLTELKDDRDRAQKRLQAELDRSVFVTRAHFETEFEAMKTVFECLSQVRLAMISLRPMVRVEPTAETEQGRLQRQCERLDDLSVAYNKLLAESEARTPFYVVELYKTIEGCLRAATMEINSVKTGGRDAFAFHGLQEGLENLTLFSKSYDKAIEIIRDRLSRLAVLPSR